MAYLSSHTTKKHKIEKGSSQKQDFIHRAKTFPGFDSEMKSFLGTLILGKEATSDGWMDSSDQRDDELNDFRESELRAITINEDTEDDKAVQTSVNNVDHQFNAKAQISVKFLDTNQTKKKLEKPLLSFYEHLKSLDDGMLNAAGTTKQHVHQTGELTTMNPDADDVEGLVKNYGKDQMVRIHN